MHLESGPRILFVHKKIYHLISMTENCLSLYRVVTAANWTFGAVLNVVALIHIKIKQRTLVMPSAVIQEGNPELRPNMRRHNETLLSNGALQAGVVCLFAFLCALTSMWGKLNVQSKKYLQTLELPTICYL